ncbi:serpin family protein [Herbihabitans rhizosphaerae]|nr:serpin family protein [Herbihabitans rhizosphaerae]
MHRVVAPNATRNACWSPFSVASALGLLAQGARGLTRDELTELLGEPGELLGRAATLSTAGHGQDEPVIAVSNTLWADSAIEVEQSFVDELAKWSGGSVRNAPFRESPGPARQTINADVAETTRGLIPELLPEGSIHADTVSALVNALYLKCAWRYRFTERETSPAPFHTPSGAVDVPTMRLTERVGYAAVDGWQVVSLPAVGGVDALILLPDNDLADAESTLDEDRLGTLLDAPELTRVRLAMPKLDVSMEAELSPALRRLGVRSVFTDEADLSGISPSRLAVSAVLHESVLKVDEQGFEGAAATAVMMRMTSVEIGEPVRVDVDRPFLLVVRHAETGVIYFVARVTEP